MTIVQDRARDELFPWGWGAVQRSLRVLVFGATTGSGRELVRMLLAAGHSPDRLELFGAKAVGLEWNGETLAVQAIGGQAPVGDVAFVCTRAELTRRVVAGLAERSVRCIDLSGAFRDDPSVPLVVPEVNGDEVGLFTPVVSAAGGTVAIAALPLAAIEREAGIREATATCLESASGRGLGGLMRLREEQAATRDPGRCYRANEQSPFPAPLVGNLIPGLVEEQERFVGELRRILGRPNLPLEVTCLRVPVERVHAVSVVLTLGSSLSPERAAECIAAEPGVRVDTDPAGPRPREVAGSDLVHVGQIRTGTRGARSLSFFAVGDQLRKGAALNALQVAARLPAG